MNTTNDVSAPKIYVVDGGEQVTYEEAVVRWRDFFALHIYDCYESTLSMVERARLHAQFNSECPCTPIELHFFESLNANPSVVSKPTNWPEALPMLEQALEGWRPFYFHFYSDIQVLDWRNEQTVATFAAHCEEHLKDFVVHHCWWEQSGLDYGDLFAK